MKFTERYKHELPKWARMLGVTRVNKESIDFSWGYFAPKFCFEAVLHRGGYFDTRYAVSLGLGWGKIHVYLPFRTSLGEGCNLPQYGVAVHNNTLWIYKGGEFDKSIGQCTKNDQWITWDLPFVTQVFRGHWILDKKLEWVQEGAPDRIADSYDFKQNDAHVEVHSYEYRLADGTVQHRTAKCTMEYRVWSRKWLPLLQTIRNSIDIEFSDEVGERSGSWKGGVMGCGFDTIPGDTIESALRRMERTRKFK
jgi:hypothetical protein